MSQMVISFPPHRKLDILGLRVPRFCLAWVHFHKAVSAAVLFVQTYKTNNLTVWTLTRSIVELAELQEMERKDIPVPAAFQARPSQEFHLPVPSDEQSDSLWQDIASKLAF